jgi:colanic acid/amylovoran biosynthesis glycosyltransferase
VRLGVVTSGFPRTSETFVLNELLALDARGLLGPIFATKPADDGRAHPGAERLAARVRVLPPVSPRDQAAVVAAELAQSGVSGVHAFFAHTPAEVARDAAARLGVPYGFSLHARDARKIASRELRDRAAGAACVVACNADVAEEVGAAGGKATLLRHGVDVARFRPAPEPPETPLTVLAVGRLVPKKGFDVLVEAAARLDMPFRLRIVGAGPERGRLVRLIAHAGIADRVTLAGPLTHDDLPEAYASAHVVVVPSVRDAAGDRDGLPNVVLEALAAGRTVVASDIAAVGSAVRHDETGLLVWPGDAGALAAAIERAASSAALRSRLAEAGRALVEREFDLEACTARLARFLEDAYA